MTLKIKVHRTKLVVGEISCWRSLRRGGETTNTFKNYNPAILNGLQKTQPVFGPKLVNFGGIHITHSWNSEQSEAQTLNIGA